MKDLYKREPGETIEMQGYINATHIGKSDFNSLVTTFNLYRKVHPKQK